MPQYKYDEPTAGEIRRAKVLAVGGKRPKCKGGKACSAACIDPGESCLVEFPDPASVGLGKLSNKIEQLSLFDTNKYYTKEYIDGVKSRREVTRLEISEGIKDAMRPSFGSKRPDQKNYYEKVRQSAIDFNKELADKGLTDKVKPLKVPVKWEVFKEVSDRYDALSERLIERMKKANASRNKAEYDRQEARLLALHDKMGKKMSKQAPEKGWLWKPDPPKTPPLSSLNTTKQFEKKEKDTEVLSKKLEKLNLEVARLLGTTNGTYVDHEDLYRSLGDKALYDSLRIRFMQGSGLGSFSDAVFALEEYSLSSTTAREIRSAQKSGYSGPVKYQDWARDLETLLRWDAMPAPQVEKYRGFRTDPDRLNNMIESAKAKELFRHETMYSWSSSLGIGRTFADSAVSGFPEGTERVIFRAINKRGVPIEYITGNVDEHEMLTHGNVRYKYLGYRTIDSQGATYHVFDVEEF